MSRVIVFVVFVVGSCSTPYSSTPDVVAAGDAGPDGADIDASDASGDASSPTDGGSEGCREAVVDGFETDPLGGLWDALVQTGATLTFDTTDKANGARSLLFALTAPGGTGYLTKRFPPAKHVCCELNVRTSGGDSARFLELDGPSNSPRVYLTWFQGQAEIYEAGPNINRLIAPITSIAVAGAWTHVRVEADYGPGTTMGTVNVYADGALAVRNTLGNATDDLRFDTIRLGSSYSASTTGKDRRTWFDDVSCGAR